MLNTFQLDLENPKNLVDRKNDLKTAILEDSKWALISVFLGYLMSAPAFSYIYNASKIGFDTYDNVPFSNVFEEIIDWFFPFTGLILLPLGTTNLFFALADFRVYLNLNKKLEKGKNLKLKNFKKINLIL